MQDFLRALITWSLSMSLVAMAFILLDPVLSRKYSAKCRYITGLIVFTGLLIPFRPNTGFSIINLSSSGLNNIAGSLNGSGSASIHQLSLIQGMNAAAQTAIEQIKTGVFSKLYSLFTNLNINKILLYLWITGMLICLLYRFISYYRFNRQIKRWSRPYKENQAIEIIERLFKEMGIRRRIDIMVSPMRLITTPILKGIFNPVILLPDVKMTNNELYLILKHELVHYKHKDHYIKFIIMLAVIVHWFNPIIYFLSKSISLLCEQTCDEIVLEKESNEQRRLYSQILVALSASYNKLTYALSNNFYGGKKDMKKRLAIIFDGTNKKKGSVILICFFLITIMSGAALVISESNNPSEPLSPAKPGVQSNSDAVIAETNVNTLGESIEYPYEMPNRKVTYGQDDSRRGYLEFDTYFDDDTGYWSYQGKPIFLFKDGRNGFLDISKNVIDNGIGINVIRSDNGDFIKLDILSARKTLDLFLQYPEGSSAPGISEYVVHIWNAKIAAEAK